MTVKETRLIRFVIVGGLCFVTNLAVLYVGTDLLGWHYLLSMAVSTVVANTLGWILNRLWTFWKSRRPWWVEYARYMSVSFSNSLISLLLMVLSVNVIGLHYLLSSAIIAILMLLFNYISHRDWSFASSEHSSPHS